MTDPVALVRLEKAALDNGFDRELPHLADWLGFGSTHAPLEVWLRAKEDLQLVVAVSRVDVAKALGDLGAASSVKHPLESAVCLDVETISELGRLLRRAYQLARTLPHQLLHDFEQRTAGMPRATEAERLIVQRVGQDVFRCGLLEYWEGRCAATGLAVTELLRASHIKPWADCATDAERLDVFNGLLLAPHLDAAFDKGFITVNELGAVVISPALAESARLQLGLAEGFKIERLTPAHQEYLRWHRDHVYRRTVAQ
ncbi:MAG TPA: HNH endonuclease [Gemmatimonadaceae bacterium]|nr:HNH endonuclease [Gemmatimonadaceae bacterium]